MKETGSGVIKLLLATDKIDHGARLRELTSDRPALGLDIEQVVSLDSVVVFLAEHQVDVLLLDLSLTDSDWVSGIGDIRVVAPDLPLIALVPPDDPQAVANALAAGADDNLSLGFENRELVLRVIEHVHERSTLRLQLTNTRQSLERLSLVDLLTKLPNRRAMEQSMLREVKKCRRTGTDLLMLLIGLDNFKRINGSMSHRVGDIVLKKAAERIQSAIRDSDELGRVGNDEFIVLLPDTRVAEGMVVAERVRLSIGQDAVKVVGNTVQVTASIGLTSITPDTMSITEAIAKAQVPLALSKSQGKNRVACVLEPNGSELDMASADSEDLVRTLLYDDVLTVASQPIHNIVAGEVSSHELLIRGPRGPLESPVELFRFSVEQDILTALDLRCLRKCVAMARFIPDIERFHLNIMPSTLLETPASELVALLANHDRPERFCLEISEQQLLGDPSCLAPNVRALQQAGLQVAIDDVGFGHSCLEGLILLRPEIMKVDKKMINGISADIGMQQLLRRLLRVAEVLETTVVAEGVETAEDLEILRDMGVVYAQGYHLGRPQPVESLLPHDCVRAVTHTGARKPLVPVA
ncbi:MAG: bifunctional diguanylate cyclase/phosphodiesterase [bacterium]